MEQDPVFKRSNTELSLDQQRERTFLLVKRLFEYDFLGDDVLYENPYRAQTFIEATAAYDFSVSGKYALSALVGLHSYTVQLGHIGFLRTAKFI